MPLIDIDESQRVVLHKRLDEMGLGDLKAQVEDAMLGKSSPLQVWQLINCFWRMGWLKGNQAAVELHNRILMGITDGRGPSSLGKQDRGAEPTDNWPPADLEEVDR